MADMAPINIQIDPETLKAQIREVVEKEFFMLAARLRGAADTLDQGEFWAEKAKWDVQELEREYQRGFKDGQAAAADTKEEDR